MFVIGCLFVCLLIVNVLFAMYLCAFQVITLCCVLLCLVCGGLFGIMFVVGLLCFVVLFVGLGLVIFFFLF